MGRNSISKHLQTQQQAWQKFRPVLTNALDGDPPKSPFKRGTLNPVPPF
jgi:hypothetical protein